MEDTLLVCLFATSEFERGLTMSIMTAIFSRISTGFWSDFRLSYRTSPIGSESSGICRPRKLDTARSFPPKWASSMTRKSR